MATTARIQARDVLLMISVQQPGAGFALPERRIMLGYDAPSFIQVGRSSKQMELSDCAARVNNCNFDGPSISRKHAKIFVDLYHKRMFVSDTDSRNGTYLNTKRLPPGTPQELEVGDMITFGINLVISGRFIPACTVRVDWEFDHFAKARARAASQPGGSSAMPLEIPDDSDSESQCGDDTAVLGQGPDDGRTESKQEYDFCV
ncbi:FHA domain-containing protein [Colletotrichum limetticola]|uniref:FHA domain-containing protein n=1 Tax=Colletotrichum limetticola TaxID=1209924 RepID=A0ABQ9PE97_9PEZI|nr:FHA domain-containing protein [Colletotrichum limetticola]